MDVNLLNRIRELVNNRAGSINAYSEIIGVPQTTLNSQFKSSRGVSIDVILLTLEKFPDVSAEWLLRGKGEMILSENSNTIVSEDVSALKAKIQKQEEENIKLQAKLDYMEEYNIKLAARLNKAEEALQQYEPKKKNIV